MRYCGIVTIYKGVRVYTWGAMGMPGSETTLEKLMGRVLGDHLQASRICFKISWRPVLWWKHFWRILQHLISVMTSLDTCGLRLSATKTIICPCSTTILGWICKATFQQALIGSLFCLHANCQIPPIVFAHLLEPTRYYPASCLVVHMPSPH